MRTIAFCFLALACDAPVDPSDASIDGATPCESDLACDDGVFCNGVETCDPALGCTSPGMRCLPGQTCDEDSDTCTSDCTGDTDADGDGHDAAECGGDDCDDADGMRYPGSIEVCDELGHDEDCNGATFGERDSDLDGALDGTCCNGTTCGDDCDDGRATAHPGATEACDAFDNDCDDAVDEGVLIPLYPDADNDGYGTDPALPMSEWGCSVRPNRAERGGDCDDTRPSVHPSAAETCNLLDDDCANGVDDGLICSCTGMETRMCDQPGVCAAGTQTCAGGTWGPCSIMGTGEVCNGLDDDCSGAVDDAGASAACAPRMGSIATCVAATCTYTCVAPYGNCNGNAADGCETNTETSIAHCRGCGMACTPGPSVTGVACVVPTGCVVTACSGSRHDCNDIFSDGCEVDINTNVAHCGGCDLPCMDLPNATESCAGSCVYTCTGGYATCPGAGTCATFIAGSDVAHCGSCSPCVPPADATPRCDAGVCNFDCNAGYARMGMACTFIDAPRGIGPLTDQVVTSRRPTIRWVNNGIANGARVQICNDAACTSVVHTQDASGTTLNVGIPLAPGTYYWRALGRYNTTVGTAASVAFRFITYATFDTTYATVAQTFLDVNGNGTDVVTGRGFSLSAYLYSSSGSGIDATRDQTISGLPATQFGFALSPAGDVNGDGRGDLLVGACGAPPTSCGTPPCAPDAGTCYNRVYVYHGNASGTFDTLTRTEITGPAGANGFGYSVGAAGDFNLDGYADIIVGAYWTARAYVYFGSATGITTAGMIELGLGGTAGTAGGFFGVSVNGAGDFNGDGYGDVVVGAPVGFSDAFVFPGPLGNMFYTLDAEWGNAQQGLSVSSAGDFDGDGLADVVIGGNGTPVSPGVMGGGLMVVFRGLAIPPITRRRWAYDLGTVVNDGLGISVTGLGDVDGDGYSDVLAGSASSARLYRGRAGATAPGDIAAAWTLTGTAGFGRWVGSPGDVNRDRRADIIVAQPPTATIYLGSGTLPAVHQTLTSSCEAGLPR